MTYLILHKVRGEPAFDIADRIKCPICEPIKQGLDVSTSLECNACEGSGYWWIIPTSGHRAYPHEYWDLEDLFDGSDYPHDHPWTHDTVPEELRDHYHIEAKPIVRPPSKTTSIDLEDIL